MLCVRSFRSAWHLVTLVTICLVVMKRLDGLNSRAVRPIPGARHKYLRAAGIQGSEPTNKLGHFRSFPLTNINQHGPGDMIRRSIRLHA
jgi:hypothetical protein